MTNHQYHIAHATGEVKKVRRRNHGAIIKPLPPQPPSKHTQAEIRNIMDKFIRSNGKYRLVDENHS